MERIRWFSRANILIFILVILFALFFFIGLNEPGEFAATPGTDTLNGMAHIV